MDNKWILIFLDAIPFKHFEIADPWIFSSADKYEKNLVGVSSKTGIMENNFKKVFNNLIIILENLHFYLVEPSISYKEIYLSYKSLSYLVKAVQSILVNDPELEFDDFLNELNVKFRIIFTFLKGF